MKKIMTILLAISMFACLLSGCVGTTVVIGNCTCPTEGNPQPTNPAVEAEGALKTGLAVLTNLGDSKDGTVSYDVTIAAVAVDKNGVIVDCLIDGISAKVSFDEKGVITSDVSAAVSTKNELGAGYGMVAWGGAKAEWNEQAAAFAQYVTGKTVEQVKGIAVTESGNPADADLASSVTIKIGGFVEAVEKAVQNAENRGAEAGDELVLAVMPKLSESTSAGEKNGQAQLDADITVLTRKDGVITSCYIDSIQAKVAFDATGVITADLTKPVQTKNEQGASYGMVAWGGAKAEWNEQAAAFAQYVTGKTAAQVAGISVTETTKPADGTDLASSVTIAIGGFMALIAKAMG